MEKDVRHFKTKDGHFNVDDIISRDAMYGAHYAVSRVERVSDYIYEHTAELVGKFSSKDSDLDKEGEVLHRVNLTPCEQELLTVSQWGDKRPKTKMATILTVLK